MTSFMTPTDRAIFDTEPTLGFLPGAESVQDIRLARGEAGVETNVPHRWRCHSLDFEWGYGGSGPADLALNILGLFVDPPTAYALHQPFKWDYICILPYSGGTLPADEIRAWIRRQLGLRA